FRRRVRRRRALQIRCETKRPQRHPACVAVGGTAVGGLVGRGVKPARSSILGEFAWLAYFLAVFAIAVYLMVLLVVPHHFNDKVAIALAGIFAALVLVVMR